MTYLMTTNNAQSINLSINQSINNSVNLSINQLINQLIKSNLIKVYQYFKHNGTQKPTGPQVLNQQNRHQQRRLRPQL